MITDSVVRSSVPMNAFAVGDRPPSDNERAARERVEEIERGNAYLAALRHDVALEREIVQEHR